LKECFSSRLGGQIRSNTRSARQIAALGCVCLTFDLHGHAATSEFQAAVTREENLADVVTAYDYLAGLTNVNADAIGVVGSSYGGYLAALLTAVRPVQWLALRAAALYRDEDWTKPKGFGPHGSEHISRCHQAC
jgi:dienelactone hydrolase